MTVAFIDPYLSFIGPCFEYDTSIINEFKKKNVDALLFCADFASKETVEKANAIPAIHFLSKLITSVVPPKIFYTLREYKKIYRQIPDGAVLFIPNIFSGKELFVLSLSVLFAPRKKFRKVIFLHRLIRDRKNQLLFYRLATVLLKRRIRERIVVPVSDSEIVAADCKKLFNQDVAVLPIPHVLHFDQLKGPATDFNGLIKIYLPGEARVDKGILTLLDAVEQLADAGNFNNFELTIQFNPVKMDEVYQSIKKRIELLKEKCRLRVLSRLNSEQYYTELMNADIILTAYMSKTVGNVEGYHSRTSGVFSEAVAAAKPIITTKDTWMAYQLQRHGSGIAVQENSVAELSAALLDIAASINEYRKKAIANAGEWASFHNATSFADKFLALCN